MLIGSIRQKNELKCFNNGILLLQEIHSSHDTVINWRDDFKGKLFFFAWNNKFMPRHEWIFR